MNLINGEPVLYWTLKKIRDFSPTSKIVIAAPEFDKKGEMASVAKKFSPSIPLFFGESEDPLNRIVRAHDANHLTPHFCRVDGLNLFFLIKTAQKMYQKGVRQRLDCVQFSHDFPVQLTADIYSIEALRKLAKTLPKNSPFRVHPKYALLKEEPDKTATVSPPRLTNDFLKKARETYKKVYLSQRDEITSKSLSIGDTLRFHYQLATSYLKKSNRVLDIACGGGYGPKLLAEHAKEVVGADLSQEVIHKAQTQFAAIPNLSFRVEDVLKMSFAKNRFDVVTSFETIEHVEPKIYLKEIERVLVPNGLFLLSTPQNSFGKIPLNPQHQHEFSLKELRDLLAQRFEIIEIKGIKQGCIIFKDDPIGTNSFVVARKKR
jgi:2-polyprenyl-3-methyl-5-hydroxy-6-metoxy-1,4-benzoquinol methylase